MNEEGRPRRAAMNDAVNRESGVRSTCPRDLKGRATVHARREGDTFARDKSSRRAARNFARFLETRAAASFVNQFPRGQRDRLVRADDCLPNITRLANILAAFPGFDPFSAALAYQRPFVRRLRSRGRLHTPELRNFD